MSSDLFAAPVLFAGALSGVFGSSTGQGTVHLMSLQMKMLSTLSNKIDVLHAEIGLLLRQNAELAAKLATLPSATVETLYRNDLEGLFVLAKEKLSARGGDVAPLNDLGSTSSLVFSDLLRELQIARSKLFATANFLQVPVVAICLQYELLLMHVTGEPMSFVRQALKSYIDWLTKWRDVGTPDDLPLVARHRKAYERLSTAEGKLPAGDGYRWSTTEVGWFGFGGPNESVWIVKGWSFSTTFQQRRVNSVPLLGSEVEAAVALLVASNLTKQEWMPQRITVVTAPPTYTRDFQIMGSDPKVFVFPDEPMELDFTPSFSIKNVKARQLVDSLKGDSLAAFEADTETLAAFSDGAQELLVFAALLSATDQLLETSRQLLVVQDFELRTRILDVSTQVQRINAQAAVSAARWASALEQVKRLTSEAGLRARVGALEAQMRGLSERSEDILVDYERAEREVLSSIPRDLLDYVWRVVEPIGRELEHDVAAVGREAEIFARNVLKNAEKALDDVGKELGRAVDNTGGLVVAVGGALESSLKLSVVSLEAAARRAAEGKLVDALWHLSTDPLKNSERVSFDAMQKSDLLRSIASSAATIYGGPAGAAAFAAWYTYRLTGDLGMALKMGAISYFTSWATKNINTLPEGAVPEGWSTPIDIDQMVRRSVLTATVGAAAIAASGGGEQDILEGFLKGGALTLASTYYHTVTNRNIDGRAATADAIDKNAIKDKQLLFFNKKGEQVLDIRLLPTEATHVGIAGATNALVGEGSFAMTRVSELPYMNAMAYLHDQICAVEGFDLATTVVTIPPAIVVTVAGTPSPLLDAIIEIAKEPD